MMMKYYLKNITASVLVLLMTSGYINAQVATINSASVRQIIDGFGAITAWHGQLSDAEANASFRNDNNNQLGLSILRVRIDPNASWTDERVNAIKAKARGATIFATPWTPPASMKTNKNEVGGELATASYAAYATYLKQFCTFLGNVDVISVQNEPNIAVTYESCFWNATQLLNFCKNNAPAIGKPVMMPETYNFDLSFSDPTLNDPVAAANITYIGGHIYGSTPFSYTNAINKGKKVWMTEHYYNSEDIGTCVAFGIEVLDCMYFNMSAYVYWYLRQPTCNLINAGGTIKKKGYAFAHFSKFVRPGYHRIDATYQPQSWVYVAAFKGDKNVVVAVNKNASTKIQTFKFSNDTILYLRKYTTSATKNLSDEGIIVCSGNTFKDTLDAQSINTYVSEKNYTLNQPTIFHSPEINIYPNPTENGRFTVSVPKPTATEIRIFNLQGQLLFSTTGSGTEIEVNSGLKAGVYIVQVNTDHLLTSKKLIVE